MYSSDQLVHRFDVALNAVKAVREGKAPFYSQYFLNPTFNSYNDGRTLFCILCVISLVRFVVSGVNRPTFKNFPCLFRILFSKYVKPKSQLKFAENFWYACWHMASFFFGIYVMYVEGMTSESPGWTRLLITQRDSKWFWFPTPAEIRLKNSMGWPFLPMSPLVRLYYLTELAFWLSCVFFITSETIRSDFYALALHHVITCVLIFFSYTCSYWRNGCVVLVTHDIADIFLYILKSLFCLTTLSGLVNSVFILFVIVFFVSRLIFFPLFCLRSAFDTRLWRLWTNNVIKTYWDIPCGVILPGFLCTLQVLHIFWFSLILKIAYRTLNKETGGKPVDVRSDASESDSDHGSKVKDKKSDSSFSDEYNEPAQLSSLPGVRVPASDSDISEDIDEKSVYKHDYIKKIRRRK